MKIVNAYIERTYNLGNYQSLKIGFEANLSETDKPLEVTRDLEMLIHQHYENTMQKEANKPAPETPSPFKQVPVPQKSPAQLANENTTKREQAAKDPAVCPKCGGQKKPSFPQCYNCWEKERAAK